jgi:pimeloyl-ACP methyl ester carboxylesterase
MKWTGDDRPPPGWMRLKEAGYLLARAARGFGHLRPRGPEDGPPALVIPGFVANDRTTMELRRQLAETGWRVHGWGLGWNLGVAAGMLQRLESCIDRMGAEQPVLVVGWSLGGLYARELARHCPGKVRAVVTLGSPFSGDLHQNNVWRLYEWVAGHRVEETPVERILAKPPVPSLAIWSRKDGIVAPRTACGLEGERDVAVQIDCAHMAFGVSRKATRRVVREIDRFVEKYAPIQ